MQNSLPPLQITPTHELIEADDSGFTQSYRKTTELVIQKSLGSVLCLLCKLISYPQSNAKQSLA